MGIRLVATDIDGTLVNDRGELSSFTLNTLQQLLARGVPLVLVTGLNPWPVKRYVRQIEHGIRAICLNGIFLLHDDRLEEGFFIDFDVAVETAHLIFDAGYVPLVYGADNVTRYVPSTVEAMTEVKKLIVSRPFQPYVAVCGVEALFDVNPAQVSICDADVRAARLFPELARAVGNRAYVVYQPGPQSWVEINHPQARKDVALLALAGRLGVSAEEIIYFGDSLNDVPVFHAIAYSVAVGNARPEVLDLAWRTTMTNNADGVAHFLAGMFEIDFEPAEDDDDESSEASRIA
jgi:Cof subfamily protein (haloacid dehalogenase superfamily)